MRPKAAPKFILRTLNGNRGGVDRSLNGFSGFQGQSLGRLDRLGRTQRAQLSRSERFVFWPVIYWGLEVVFDFQDSALVHSRGLPRVCEKIVDSLRVATRPAAMLSSGRWAAPLKASLPIDNNRSVPAVEVLVPVSAAPCGGSEAHAGGGRRPRLNLYCGHLTETDGALIGA